MVSCGCWYHRSIDIDASLDSISTLQASLFHYSFLFPGFMLVQKLLLLHHSSTVWGLFLSSDNSCMFFHVVSIWVSFRFSTPQPHNNSVMVNCLLSIPSLSVYVSLCFMPCYDLASPGVFLLQIHV